MLIPYEEFAQRVDELNSRIAAACSRAGRNPAELEILAVTKTHPPEAAEYAARYGLRAVGENRVQEGVEKRRLCSAKIAWELIGHLQSNKARLAAESFDRIQSVDSEKLLGLLDSAAADTGRPLPILLQVNAGRDNAKFGVALEGAASLLKAALANRNLRVDGLMTVAPLSNDPAVAQRCFANLRELRDRLAVSSGSPLRVLSMGMTADLEPAIAEGSTLVRVGSALFGDRPSP